MGFKADTSFLQNLTMGALATRAAMDYLKQLGFQPIVLERYSTSNKIWSTKVKRLRLADVLCVRTGLRIEVRGKSDLQVRMSDSPTNLSRRWDTGLRGDDLVCIVACEARPQLRVCGIPSFFAIGDLRASVHLSTLGPPKSAGEGAERDRIWKTTVPSDDGEVLEVTPDQIRTRLASGRRQTYSLKGKAPYVSAGMRFSGGTSVIAGDVPRIVDPTTLLGGTWDPEAALRSDEAIDRYAGAKALAHVETRREVAAIPLSAALRQESEPRTALEIAGALAKLGGPEGFDHLSASTRRVDEAFPAYLRMEAVLILSEIDDARSTQILDDVAHDRALLGNELRQAAVWGLGKAGTRAYERLVPYVADDEADVALHAIAGFGSDAPRSVVEALAALLSEGAPRATAGASEALRLIGSRQAAETLNQLASAGGNPWIIATLGRIPKAVLSGCSLTNDVARAIAPVTLLTEDANWISSRSVATDFQFLLQQNL